MSIEDAIDIDARRKKKVLEKKISEQHRVSVVRKDLGYVVWLAFEQ